MSEGRQMFRPLYTAHTAFVVWDSCVHRGHTHSILSTIGSIAALPSVVGAPVFPTEIPGKVQAIQRTFQSPISLAKN